MTPAHYHVERHSPRGWAVVRRDQPAHVGVVETRKQALMIARLLAGRSGTVTVEVRPHVVR